jgi:hypothetical protein
LFGNFFSVDKQIHLSKSKVIHIKLQYTLALLHVFFFQAFYLLSLEPLVLHANLLLWFFIAEGAGKFARKLY